MSDQEERSQSVAVYMRVSGEGQRRRETIENQRKALDQYVTAHGIRPYGVYEDEAVSGKWVPFPKRPQAQRLLADIAARHVDTIIVWKLDRFGRNAREILNAVHDLNAAGAQLVSMKENVDTRTSAGRFFLTVLSGVAELEYDMIMERTGAGMERRLDKGDEGAWMGGIAPYGYKGGGRQAACAAGAR
jgi:site-specific DNA recombinase